MFRCFLLTWIVFVTGCQSLPKTKDFESVQVGMEKPEVLEIIGGPQVSRRWQGKDRWSYRFYENNVTVEKEVHFYEGKVVYTGNPVQPQISAEQQDKINNEHVLQMQQYRKEYSEMKSQAKKPSSNTDAENTPEAKWEEIK